MSRTPLVILNGLGNPAYRAMLDVGDGSLAALVQLVNPAGADIDIEALLDSLSRADIGSSGNLALTNTANSVSASVAGRATASFDIGTAGAALGGSAVIAFEVQRTAGGPWAPTYAYPAGGGYRVNTTGVGGAWSVETAGCIGVRARCSVVGVGAVTVAITLTGAARIQGVAPVEVGQTTRRYKWPASVSIGTTDGDANSGPIAAGEVLVHAKTAAMWINVNAAAEVGVGMPLEAGEKFHFQISPGDIIHAIQDTVPGTLIILPVA